MIPSSLRIEKRGKELAATQRLLQKLAEQWGWGFIDLLAVDGLYAYRDFFRFCRQSLGCHGVVKTEWDRVYRRDRRSQGKRL